MECLHCRGKGTLSGCPACGKMISVGHTATIEVTAKKLDYLKVPKYYEKQVWDKQTLIDTHKEFKSQVLLEKYAESLDRIYKIFSRGELPNKSFIVVARRGFGKLTWAYSCMQQALAHGYSVMPIIDNTQFKRLNIISSDRIYSSYLKDIPYTIDQYLSADVVFISIDPDNFSTSFRTLDSLLSKRSRLGLPTYILSRLSVERITLADFDDTFKDAVSKQQQDWNKYITVIGGLV